MAKDKKGAKDKGGVKVSKTRGLFRMFYKTFFDVPSWIGVYQARYTNRTLFQYLKAIFKIKRSTRQETFKQAIERMQLTEQDLRERVKVNNRNKWVFLITAGALCIYSGYLLFTAHVGGFVLGVAVLALSLVRAYQFSFWNFQIKHKKLGCSYKEWRRGECSSSNIAPPT